MARTKTAEIEARAAERRAAPRVLVDLDVDYRSENTYLFASSRDISETGIFVRTIEPLPPGTQLNLRFGPDDEDEILELEGEVMWVNPYRPDALANLDPGMGVRFVPLRTAMRQRLLELIRRIAYID
ncbi:MAG TPA: TIGR02266 family protein [Kofleriaceae bacterium]|nr:TIGR02266 family protein [Kofleriaceae bacterium]